MGIEAQKTRDPEEMIIEIIAFGLFPAGMFWLGYMCRRYEEKKRLIDAEQSREGSTEG